MKRLAALLLLIGTPAVAADDSVTILRGTPAPPTPWYQPPPPPPDPVVIYQPMPYTALYPQYFYVPPPARQHPRGHNSGANGWPLLRR